jgi:CRISPR/Cas system-associated protein Cas10 (large subunit of type III CRISPR-Cas system)
MKDRPYGFLAQDKIDQDSEIFDYIRELHNYLWDYIRRIIPSASGNLDEYIDKGLKVLDEYNRILSENEEEIETLLRLQIGL